MHLTTQSLIPVPLAYLSTNRILVSISIVRLVKILTEAPTTSAVPFPLDFDYGVKHASRDTSCFIGILCSMFVNEQATHSSADHASTW